MKKFDLAQPLALTFAGQEAAFGRNGLIAEGEFENAGDLADYEYADCRIVGAVVRPWKISALEKTVQFDSMAVLEQRKSLEELRKSQGLGLVKSAADLARARTLDFSLDLVYSLRGLDGISAISDLEKLWTGGFRIFRPVWTAGNKIAGGLDDASVGRSELGENLVARAMEQNLLLDLTNLSEKSLTEFLGQWRGKNRLVTATKNLDEKLLGEIAAKHGVVSVSFALANFAEDAEGDFLWEKIGSLRNSVGDDHLVLGTELHGLRADRVVPGQQRVAGLTIFEEKLVGRFGAKFAEKFLWGNAERILMENLG